MSSNPARETERRQTAGNSLRRRVEVMENLGRLMVEARDASDVREQILVACMQSVQCQRGSLWEVASGGGAFVAQSEVRRQWEENRSVLGQRVGAPPERLLHRLRRGSGPVLVEGELRGHLAEILAPSILDHLDPTSLLLVPLFHFNQLIGFLLLDQPESRESFGDSDLEVAGAAANYAALVLENLQNRIEEQERVDRMAALAELAATLTIRHSLEEVLKVITEHGAALTRSQTCTILLVEPDSALHLAAAIGLGESVGEVRIPLDDPTVQDFIREDGPVIVEDIDRDQPSLRRLLVRPDVKSIHLFPLWVAGTVFGVLTLGYRHRYRPDPPELNLAETLASVAAGAVQNARAFEMEVEQRDLLRTVAEISRRVSGILDTDWMLQEVCNLLGRELEYDYVHTFLVQSRGTELSYAAGSGEVGQEIREGGLRLPINRETLLGRAVKENTPYRSGEVEGRLFRVPDAGLEEVGSEIAIPIIAHNQSIGLLDVQSLEKEAFGSDDERLLKIVSDQVSVALDNARHHSEVQAQARLDSLTQVLNHGAFVMTLHSLVDHCRQEEVPLSLIMLDVDYFKEYNDQFGHVAGDAALKTTVQAIRAHVKSRDAVGRWGGEEFGIALLGADKSQAAGVAQRIRETLASLVPVDRVGREMPPPSVSQGIAQLDVDATDADHLVDLADQALYRAKSAGRDQVRLAGEESTRS